MRQLFSPFSLVAFLLPFCTLHADPGKKKKPSTWTCTGLTPPDKLVFGNRQLTLQIRKKDGAWQSLEFGGLEGSLIKPAIPSPPLMCR